MEKTIYLTKEGIAKLKEEVERLIRVDRQDIIGRLKEARELGDLSENSEYAEARDQQAMIEGRIKEIELVLRRAKMIDDKIKAGNQNEVSIGSKVTFEVKFQDENEVKKETYYIGGSAESDPVRGMISAESPMGAALLGAKKGEKREVPVPDDGVNVYKVLKIE